MSKYSKGRVAIAVCDRCHFKKKLSELRADGDVPSLRVCRECYDVKDPWRLPPKKEKSIALKNPRPDLRLEPGVGYLITEDGAYVILQDGAFVLRDP